MSDCSQARRRALAISLSLAVTSAPAADATERFLVELSAVPAALVYAQVLEQGRSRGAPREAVDREAQSAALAQGERVREEQAAFLATLGRGRTRPQPLFQLRRALNGVALALEPAELAAVQALPQVRAVRPLPMEYPLAADNVELVGAPAVWEGVAGRASALTGKGVRIGIIDTGIDYQHAHFGGGGSLADYEANDRTVAPDRFFPTAKVAGGWDFAGDNYFGMNEPKPDADPMDCSGHGTHVAGIAAGLGVSGDGVPFPGPLDTRVPFADLRIAPGVAPEAQLYALRVFGCSGGSQLAAQAIDWALDPDGDGNPADHLDVINLSLGTPYGSPGDVTALAAENAARAGVVVVAAAGNNGDTFFIHGSPAAAARVISVAASGAHASYGSALRVTAPAALAGWYPATHATTFGQPPPAAGLEAEVARPTPTDACGELQNGAALAGRIALIDRGSCLFVEKARRAQEAGAVAVVFANNGGVMGSLIGDDPAVTLPAMLVDTADGERLKGVAAGLRIRLASGADQVSRFSSRGPVADQGGTLRPKPDLTAPGERIVSALTGVTCKAGSCARPDPSGYLPGSQAVAMSGTSMAAPHVAGMMALLRQANPGYSVEELKALAMNGALHDPSTLPQGAGERHSAAQVGSGRMDVPQALKVPVIAYADDGSGAVSVGFETLEVAGSASEEQRVRLVNHGSAEAVLDLAIDTVADAPGVEFTLTGASRVTVPAGGSLQVGVRLTAEAARMRQARDKALADRQAAPAPFDGVGALRRHFLTEESAYLTASRNGTRELRLPLYAAPRPVSEITASRRAIATLGAPEGNGEIGLVGSDLCTGSRTAGPACGGEFPQDRVSLLTPFEWQVESPRLPHIPAFADLRYAGVAYDSARQALLFGVATWGPWATPSQVSVNIWVDNNLDGEWDRLLFNSSPGMAAAQLFGNGSAAGQDVFAAAVGDVRSEMLVEGASWLNLAAADTLDTAPFFSDVALLAATREQLGVSGAFAWKVVTCPGLLPVCALERVAYDEAAGPYRWHIGAQGLDFHGAALVQDLNGTRLPVHWNREQLNGNGSLGALLLHHHNRTGSRAEVIPVQ